MQHCSTPRPSPSQRRTTGRPAPSPTRINGLISLYEASNPNVTIKRTYVPVTSFTAKVLQQALAHKLPDILILDNQTVQAIASTGALTSITPYTKGWAQLSGYFSSSLGTATWKGNLYGLPVGNNDLALYYNKAMFKAAGIMAPPATWTDFRADAKKLTTGHVYGFAFSAAKDEEGTWTFEPYLWANGGDLQHVDSTASVEALTFLTQIVQDGSASKEVLNWGQGDVVNQFFAGNAAMMEMGTWDSATRSYGLSRRRVCRSASPTCRAIRVDGPRLSTGR